MAGTSFFSDMMQNITDRGRKLLLASPRAAETATPSLENLCEMLLSSRGEASGMAIAAEVLDRWSNLEDTDVECFFFMLLHRFGPDGAAIEKAVEHYNSEKSPEAIIALHEAAEPRRQELIRRLNLAPRGTATLVRMRERLLALKSAELRTVDADFVHLFGSWFNRGFLTLRPIGWSTSAAILEKIIRYEAVHEIGSWEELRRRLQPSDRRCFAFFHPRLEDEPLVFVEVALTRSMPEAIEDVLAEDRATIRAEEATTAVFYSISNCQDGLRGISFGNFLIKQVVEDLRRDLPDLKTFVTLSPAPGFARWLADERADACTSLGEADRSRLALLDTPDWFDDKDKAASVRQSLLPLAAQYFISRRTSAGRPLDTVARFHLGNGARLEQINFLADRSGKAMSHAHGLMVNYLYKLDDIVANHEALAQRNEVVAAPAIHQLAKSRSPANGKRRSGPSPI